MKPLNFALSATLAASAAALLAAPSRAVAQYGTGYNSGPNTALMEQRKAIQAAEKDRAKIAQDIQRLKTRLQAKFETKDDWETAKTNLKAAETVNEAAKKKMMAKLLANPAYKAAKEKQAKADQQVAALEAQGDKASAKDLAAAQQARIDAGVTVRKMESDATENDPGVAEAKEKLADAKKAWQALQDELTQVLEQDPDYLQAKQELDAADANVKAMKLSLQQAAAQDAAARRQAAEAERQSRSNRSGRSSRGGGYGR